MHHVKFNCIMCDGSPKTDNLVLVNIRNRDYLVCQNHSANFLSKTQWKKTWESNDNRNKTIKES